MALETVVFPIPSEAVMPLAGWKLIEEKGHAWWWLIFAGAIGGAGSTAGGVGVYYVSKLLGAPFLRKYGKYVLISQDDLDMADRFFDRWGVWAVFFGRMLPLVRTLVSVPAGVTAMPIVPFTIFTFMGSFVWAVGLAYAGYTLGENYEDIRAWMEPVQYPVAIILGAFIVWYVYRHVKKVWFEESASAAGQE